MYTQTGVFGSRKQCQRKGRGMNIVEDRNIFTLDKLENAKYRPGPSNFPRDFRGPPQDNFLTFICRAHPHPNVYLSYLSFFQTDFLFRCALTVSSSVCMFTIGNSNQITIVFRFKPPFSQYHYASVCALLSKTSNKSKIPFALFYSHHF